MQTRNMCQIYRHCKRNNRCLLLYKELFILPNKMGIGGCGISSYRQIQLKQRAYINDKEKQLLVLANQLAPKTTKFVYFSQEQSRVYNDVPVLEFVSYYINCTTEVTETQTMEEWKRDMDAQNTNLLKASRPQIPVDPALKFEGVMFQFLGELGDYLQKFEPSAEDLELMDGVVDEILPQTSENICYFNLRLIDDGMSAKNFKTSLTRGSHGALSTETQNGTDTREQTRQPKTMGFSNGQNTKVTKSFLSYEGMKQAYARGVELGFDRMCPPAQHDRKAEFDVIRDQMQYCAEQSITEFTVETVLWLSEPTMRMHMDRDEIEKAMRNGKVYMVMSGMTKSPAGAGGKIIIPFRMIRQSHMTTMEIPTYDSHTVEIQQPGMAQKNKTLHMEPGSVNMLVHFKAMAPGEDDVMEDEQTMMVVGKDDETQDRQVIVGRYQQVLSENRWPRRIIEEIVDCLQDCTMLPQDEAVDGFSGQASIVQTPAQSHRQNEDLKSVLAAGGLQGDTEMWVKVMGKGIEALHVANQNLLLTLGHHSTLQYVYPHMKRDMSTILHKFPTFEVNLSDTSTPAMPIYPSKSMCTCYGIPEYSYEVFNNKQWNLAAANVMFGMDFLVIVTLQPSGKEEDVQLTPSTICKSTRSDVLNSNVKCITYNCTPSPHPMRIELAKMPDDLEEIVKSVSLLPVFKTETGEDEPDDTLIFSCNDGSDSIQHMGHRVRKAVQDVHEIEHGVVKDDEAESPDYYIIRTDGPNGKCVVELKFVAMPAPYFGL